MADKIDPPDDDAARDRRVYLDELSRMQSDIAALHAENRRYRDVIAARPAPPEIWWPLKAVIAVDWGDRPTERQEKTDHERMRRWCATGMVVAERRGPGNGRWWVRMQEGPDGDMTPMRMR